MDNFFEGLFVLFNKFVVIWFVFVFGNYNLRRVLLDFVNFFILSGLLLNNVIIIGFFNVWMNFVNLYCVFGKCIVVRFFVFLFYLFFLFRVSMIIFMFFIVVFIVILFFFDNLVYFVEMILIVLNILCKFVLILMLFFFLLYIF